MIDVLGVVLAGGLSRRMGGAEKSLLNINDAPLIARVSDRLKQQVTGIIINANGNRDRFGFLNLPVTGDTVEGYAGPLAGVLAGMRWASENTNATHIITAAADTPFFPIDYADSMIAKTVRDNIQIALASSNGRRHPVFGLWNLDLADELEDFLVKEEGRKVMLFVERHRNCLVEFEGSDPDPFFNVNTPDDMHLAEKIAREQNSSCTD
ncbi:MAG: molybdenum cofactor guanylyltransferase MobA [Rhizobiaceae bacterium]